VFGESYSRGWKAWCGPAGGKERDLGSPTVIDGYANGWRVGRDCQRAHFAFAPQRLADTSYWFSAIGAAILALVLAAEAVLRQRRGIRVPAPPSAWVAPPADPVRRLPVWGALAAGVLAAGLGGVVFALRAGAVMGPVVLVLLLFLGVNARRLLGLAFLGLVAMVVLYLAYPSPDAGGFYFPYAQHYLNAHWVAVGVVCALAAASVIMAWDLRTRRGPPLARTRWLGRRLGAATNGRVLSGRRSAKTGVGR